MQVPKAEPVKLGSGHCCACASTCNHIGPIRLCSTHLALERMPRSPEDFLSDQDRQEWARWAERNRLRKERIRMETGIGQVG